MIHIRFSRDARHLKIRYDVLLWKDNFVKIHLFTVILVLQKIWVAFVEKLANLHILALTESRCDE